MWFYNGKAESPKVRHSKCVDCFAIKFRQFDDGLRQTQGGSKNSSQ
jgi:ubiquitin